MREPLGAGVPSAVPGFGAMDSTEPFGVSSIKVGGT